jgi:YidC/Oxa1 family membrane protein insertase
MNTLYQILIAPLEAMMGVLLSAIYEAIGSYGVSIFFLSLLINVVLFPLFQMAERWQEAERQAQRILKPKLQQFRQAFSGEERHVMVQSLYRQTGYHPAYAMRSSFGLFLQLPFWIAAYQMLSRYQPLNGASFLAFEDLGKPDSLLWGFNLLPFVMTALNVAAAFVYTKSLSRTEQIQPLVLASLFLVLLYSASAGLLLYWTFNSLFSLLRITLLDGTPTKDRPPAASTISPSQTIPSPEASSAANHSGGTEQLRGASKSDLGPTADDSRRTGIR